jgi:hypothetical protein
MRQLRFLLILLAAALAAIAVWTWLPPTDETQDGVERAPVRYEVASQPIWPGEAYSQKKLSETQRDTVAAAVRHALGEVAAGDAVTGFDAEQAVDAFVRSESDLPDVKVVAWRGEVVYFDFLRRTPKGRLLVRAGVRLSHRIGTWDAGAGELKHVTWIAHDTVEVRDYTLDDYGDVWKVEAVEDYGYCQPDGTDLREGPPPG